MNNTEVHIITYYTGNTLWEYEMVNGKYHGICKEFSNEGHLLSLRRFVHGEISGTNEFFWPEGERDSIVQIKNFLFNGVEVYFPTK